MGLTRRPAGPADELLGAYALDALDEGDWAAVEQRLAVDRDLAAAAEELRHVAGWLGVGEAATPPTDLRQRILARAVTTRPGHRDGSPKAAAQAYRDQVAELADLLSSLAPTDWTAPTTTGFTVHELVAHLVAVDDYLLACLGHSSFTPPVGTEHDHLAMTLPTVAAHRDQPAGATFATWLGLVERTVGHLADLSPERLATRVAFHGLTLRLRTVLLVRVFELWAHAEDVRRAVGRPAQPPPADRLHLMANLAVRSLPLGLGLAGLDHSGRTAKLVLTGEGGGTWTQALGAGPASGPPEVTLVADVVDFCRLAAQRLAAADLAHEVEGDGQLAEALLVGAQVFAA